MIRGKGVENASANVEYQAGVKKVKRQERCRAVKMMMGQCQVPYGAR